MNDVIDKVLACPIRPQFVIASIGPAFDLDEAHRLIAGRFGSQIPVITSISQGIFGQNATTNEFEEKNDVFSRFSGTRLMMMMRLMPILVMRSTVLY